MIMNMSYYTNRMIEKDEYFEYLSGIGVYDSVKYVPGDRNSDVSFPALIRQYNFCYLEHPELSLDKKFFEIIHSSLKSNISPYICIGLYESFIVQLSLQKKDSSCFELTQENINTIVQDFKRVIFNNKEEFSKYKSFQGRNYADGLYGFALDCSHTLEQETGITIF